MFVSWRMKLSLALVALSLAFAVSVPDAYASGGGHGGDKKKGEKAKAPKKQRSSTSLASWVMVDPFTITIIQDGRLRGRLTVSFGMDVPDDKLREYAELMMPRLRDSWLSALNLYAATTLRPRRAADLNTVTGMLQQTADTVLAKPGSKVLLGAVAVQMTP